MKGKKRLALLLAAFMTVSSASMSAFATEGGSVDAAQTATDRTEASNTANEADGQGAALNALSLTKVEAENNMVQGEYKAAGFVIELANVGYVEDSMNVKLYHDDTLLATTTCTASVVGQTYSTLNIEMICSGDAALSSGWTTTLAETDWYGKDPNKLVVHVDGNEKTLAIETIASYDTKYVAMEIAKKKVAEVNGKKYSTFKKAVNAAKTGETVKLIDDIHVGLDDMKEYQNTKRYTYITIVSKQITIDLNGRTIDLKEDAKNSGAVFYQFITLAYDANVTITGNGKIDLDVSNVADAYIFYTVRYSGYGKTKLTIENGTFYGDPCVVKNKGENEIVVKGGTFGITKHKQKTYPCQIKGVLNSTGVSRYIQMEGGTIIGNDPRHFDDGNLVKTGYAVHKNGENYTVVPDNTTAVTLTTKYKDYRDQYNANLVEMIDEKYAYTTWDEAYAKAKDGDTITLAKDMSGEGIVIDKDITLDLDGYTYDITGGNETSRAATNDGIQVLEDHTVTIKNGTIKSEKTDYLIQNYADLSLVNVTLDGSALRGEMPSTLSHNHGSLHIDSNSKIISKFSGYALEVCEHDEYNGAQATVQDGAQILGFVQMRDLNGGSFGGKIVDGTDTALDALGDYSQNGSRLIRAEKRMIEIATENTMVEMDDVVTIQVRIKGNDITNASYDFTYDPTKFVLQTTSGVGAPTNGTINEVLGKAEGQDPYANGDVLATYTFQALAQTEDVTADFTLSNTKAVTRAERLAGHTIDATTNKTVSVALRLKDYTPTVYVDGQAVTGERKSIPYNGKNHTFHVETPQGATVSYRVEDSAVETVSVQEKKTYSISYTVAAQTGYRALTKTFTLTIYSGNGGGSSAAKNDTVSFETNGGSAIAPVSKRKNATVDLAKYSSQKDGYSFAGWYTDPQLTNKVSEIKLNGDVTLYAKWVQNDTNEVTNPNVQTNMFTDAHIAYLEGDNEGYVYPNASLTRAEAAAIFYRLLKEEVRSDVAPKENGFADVVQTDWFYAAVSTLSALDVIQGRETDTFAPHETVTRAELVTMLVRLTKAMSGEKNMFADASAHWAKNSINIAAKLQWVQGDNAQFRPDDTITRAETVTIMNRVLNRLPRGKADLPDDMITPPDNADENTWYYLAIQEAVNGHDVEQNADAIQETKTERAEK